MDSRIQKEQALILNAQEKLCNRFSVGSKPVYGDALVAISKDLLSGKMPINGLRHPITDNLSGWYIWAGDEIPQEIDAFQVRHAEHFIEDLQYVLPYLGLPPGWRFQIDDKGYEDIWEDKKLLEVK